MCCTRGLSAVACHPCFVGTIPNQELPGCLCSSSLLSELLPLWSCTFTVPHSQSPVYCSNGKVLSERNICQNPFKTFALKKENLDDFSSTVCFFSVIAPQSKAEQNSPGRQSVSVSPVYSALTSLRQSHLLRRTVWGTLQRANILPGQAAATRLWEMAQCPCLWKSHWLFTSNFIICSALLHGNMLSSHTPL